MNNPRHPLPPTPRIGVDIGRVIIGGDGPDTSFFGHDHAAAMATPAIPGAFEAVAALVERFAGAVWLVSKCGPKIQARSREWLDHHGFWAATGVDPDNLRFCRERPDKAIHAKRLGLTHFVDDRLDVLTHLHGLVGQRFLFGPQPQRSPAQVAGLIAAPTWAEVLAHLGDGTP